MMRFLLLLATAVPLLAQTCTFSANPNAFNLGSASVEGKISVSTQGLCNWTATASDSWIHITNGNQIFFGSGSLSFLVDASTSTQVRKGTITVGSELQQQVVTFTQSAGTCNYQILTPLTASYPVTGGSGSFQFTTGCDWNATANVGWIALTPRNGLGDGTVSYTVAANGAPNSCVAARSGSITLNGVANGVASPSIAVSQDGFQASLAFASPSATFGSAASTGRIQVVTGDGCSWSSFSDASWLQITGNSSAGSGNGAITFSLTQNVGPTRTGHINMGTQVFTVIQGSAAAPAPVLSALINSASGSTGPIAPGEIVALFGSNIGPATGVAFGQTIPLNLAGVQVMFGNTPAALTYVSASQINAIVPYGVAGFATTQILVQYQNQTSNTMSATVQTAAPAIFSADLSGHGPGAILNSDYKLNSNTNPAPIGSVVMIYGTGGGTTTPPSSDGSLAPSAEPFARLLLPVTVTIGGVPAQVLYAGGAPGLVSGLTQFNVLVPAGVTPGPSVPVLLHVGGFQSQAGLTVAVAQ